MRNAKDKVISKNIKPIFVGGLVSTLIHWCLLHLLVTLLSHEKEPSYLVLYLIAFFIPAMIGGFIATLLFDKTKLIHSIIASLVFMLVIIFPEISNAFLGLNHSKQTDFFFLKISIIIVFAAMLGGYLGIRIKRKKVISNTNSSPHDTPSQ